MVDQDGQPRLTHSHRTDQPSKKAQIVTHCQPEKDAIILLIVRNNKFLSLVDQDRQPRLTHSHGTDQPIKKAQNITHCQPKKDTIIFPIVRKNKIF